ncbi:MAG: hypothetical protein ACOYYS_06140 [Chloroflexota bacterium]
MSSDSLTFQLEEISGNRYPDLRAAQRLAATELAGALATTIRSMLADGLLAAEGGRVVLTPGKEFANA